METNNQPQILVFSTEKISDPGIDMAGLLELHYPPSVKVISVPCSSGIKPKWIMRAFDDGFCGVFIAADGTDCPYSEKCGERTAEIVSHTQEMMDNKNINKARLKMAAICSVCSESFVNYMKNFTEYLSKLEVCNRKN